MVFMLPKLCFTKRVWISLKSRIQIFHKFEKKSSRKSCTVFHSNRIKSYKQKQSSYITKTIKYNPISERKVRAATGTQKINKTSSASCRFSLRRTSIALTCVFGSRCVMSCGNSMKTRYRRNFVFTFFWGNLECVSIMFVDGTHISIIFVAKFAWSLRWKFYGERKTLHFRWCSCWFVQLSKQFIGQSVRFLCFAVVWRSFHI